MFFFSLSPSVYAQSLDWTKLNSSLETLVEEHVDYFDFLESGVITVDPASNLNSGLLGLQFSFASTELTLLSSPNPQRMVVDGGLNLKTTDLGAFQKVGFEASIHLKGELLLFVRHVNKLFDDCANLDPQNNSQVELCLYIEAVNSATSATELEPALQSLKNFILLFFPGNSAQDISYRNLITKILIQQTITGTTASLLVNDLEFLGLKISGEISLNFTDNGLELKTSGATLLNTTDYNRFITSLEKTLVGIQNQDQTTLDMVTGYTYFTFELLEGLFL